MSRVVLVGKGPPARDGIATFLTTLRAGLANTHQVVLVNLTHKGPREGGRLTVGNVVRTIRDGRAVWRASRSADVVHVHSALAPGPTLLRAGALALAGRLRGAGVVVHAHGGLVERWLTGRARRLLARAALWPAHVVVAVSEGSRTALGHALPGGRVTLIPNGVEVSRFQPADEAHDPPRILYAGVISARKGLLDLITASALLSDRGVRHEVALVGGEPPEGPQAESVVRARAGANRGAIRLLESQPFESMPSIYRSADVFCLPSHWEAMPLSLLEAMATGLPIVATPVGDVPRLVEEGETGFLVPVGQPERLADALQSLLDDVTLRRRMGQAARRRVADRFSVEGTLAQIESLYAELSLRKR